LFHPFHAPADGLYGILADGDQINAAIQAGLRCVQLRHKSQEGLLGHIALSMKAAASVQAQLFINDHWQEALAYGATANGRADRSRIGPRLGLHLGQEDLLALSPDQQDALLANRDYIMLGLSSHSLWELARAAGCGASLIACGPVQATTTKDMPWLPQGLDNLAWWIRHSPAPVVAIGGLLTPADLGRFAAAGPAALCVVRALGQTLSHMQQVLPELRSAAARRGSAKLPTHSLLPHPVLPHF
jgi:hydroxymethylpyrimidine kinase/phosphomethylpyrimidine kinase/thiamine-phosphate diphosphorylase